MVLVGVLILAGAVNTALIGANGVMNRVAEDGVLTDWFRKPHRKFGTTSRIINLIALLQMPTIVISLGDVDMLGEAYAFGVVWSFAMKSLSVLVLRYKMPGARAWKVPMNFHIRGKEVPVGLGLITVALFALAIINVITKEVATISGVGFTLAFFTDVRVVRTLEQKRHAIIHHAGDEKEEFRLHASDDLTPEADARPARQYHRCGAQSASSGASGQDALEDRHAAAGRSSADDQGGHTGGLGRTRPRNRPGLRRFGNESVFTRRGAGREGGQTCGTIGRARRRPLDCDGANRGAAEKFAHRHRAFADADACRTGPRWWVRHGNCFPSPSPRCRSKS